MLHQAAKVGVTNKPIDLELTKYMEVPLRSTHKLRSRK